MKTAACFLLLLMLTGCSIDNLFLPPVPNDPYTIMARRDLPAGAVIQESDLETFGRNINIPNAILWHERGSIIGHKALHPIARWESLERRDFD